MTAPGKRRAAHGMCSTCAVQSTINGTYRDYVIFVPYAIDESSRTIDEDGYVLVFTSRGSQREHSAVMANMVGREMVGGENVHHKNGVRTDNRPENLELWWTPPRTGQRVTDLLRYVAYEHADTVIDLIDKRREQVARGRQEQARRAA